MTGPVWNPMAQQYEPKPVRIADFLDARISEDEERVSQAIGTTPWAVNPPNLFHGIAVRHLGDCEAKRLIVELHQDGMAEDRWEGDPDPLPGYCTRCHNRSEHQQEAWPCLTLRLLAVPYGSHPDYDEAWKP